MSCCNRAGDVCETLHDASHLTGYHDDEILGITATLSLNANVVNLISDIGFAIWIMHYKM